MLEITGRAASVETGNSQRFRSMTLRVLNCQGDLIFDLKDWLLPFPSDTTWSAVFPAFSVRFPNICRFLFDFRKYTHTCVHMRTIYIYILYRDKRAYLYASGRTICKYMRYTNISRSLMLQRLCMGANPQVHSSTHILITKWTHNLEIYYTIIKHQLWCAAIAGARHWYKPADLFLHVSILTYEQVDVQFTNRHIAQILNIGYGVRLLQRAVHGCKRAGSFLYTHSHILMSKWMHNLQIYT